MLKFSSVASTQNTQRSSIKRLSSQFNSSSGTAISVLYEKKDIFEPVSFAYGKNEVKLNKDAITKSLQTYKFGDFSLTDKDDLAKIADILHPQAVRVKDYFNEFFFAQDWHSLYAKFITNETYFDPDSEGTEIRDSNLHQQG
jgi:hypothetical protein